MFGPVKLHRSCRFAVSVPLLLATLLTTRPASARQETITWTNGDVRLTGDLHLPEGPGPFPALVYFHGAGDQTRKSERISAIKFPASGFAFLIYDKRGCGDSTGNWRDTDFEGLARDGISGIAELKNRPDIDPNRIGVIGISQGGWLGPLAATLSSDIKFVIALSGPTIPPDQQNVFYWQSQLQLEGLNADEIAEAIHLVKLDQLSLDSGDTAELEAALAEAKSKPWFTKSPVKHPRDRANPDTLFYTRVHHYDPVPVLKKLNVPLFAAFGELDIMVPGPQCARELEEIGKSMKIKPKVHLLPGAAHNLSVPGKAFATEYWPEVLSWLTAVTK